MDSLKKNVLVHRDDKISFTTDGTLKEKRLSVSVSGEEHKLLSVVSLRNNSRKIYGKRVCEEVMNLLKKWNCVNSIYGMVFDTTSLCDIQKCLGKPNLLLACVLELLQNIIFCSQAIEKSKTPEVEVLKRFKNL